MKKSIWSYLTYLASYLTSSPIDQDPSQQPILGEHGINIVDVHNEFNVVNVVAPAVTSAVVPVPPKPTQSVDVGGGPWWPFPVFKPPTGKLKWAGSDFECAYPDMPDWEPCTEKDVYLPEESQYNRSCWLRHKITKQTLDIHTDYEKVWPNGTHRNYTLVIEDGQWNADGLWAKDAKLINGTYPGPTLQACWGDILNIKVINKLKHNGTALHMHGIRQLNSMHMDGVPGITQCPIAPGDSYTYSFRVTQYGDSWYHSHYSVQYADGMLGPITLHGPTTGDWDEPKPPLLMSDWFHQSAFSVIHGQIPGYPTILLNGTGDISKHFYVENNPKTGKDIRFNVAPDAPVPRKFTTTFQAGKRYLLRLINTSFTTNFIFSIDHHNLTVVSIDFVPVYANVTRDHIQIGIGQRFTVIVEAKPNPAFDGDIELDSFWIRTSVVKCFRDNAAGFDDYDRTGILRYNENNVRIPTTKPPGNFTLNKCQDEQGFTPKLAWNIPKALPANSGNNKQSFGQEFSVHLNGSGPSFSYPLGKWAFERSRTVQSPWNPMQIDYDDPFFLRLNDGNSSNWKAKWMIVPAEYGEKDWIFLAITGMRPGGGSQAAHPIHLHGHDFAVLRLEEHEKFPDNVPLEKFNFDFNNPLRRDVVLLPDSGWMVIAFKTDNPGNWIMHCHIAFHASEGLALQINERQFDANLMWPNDKLTWHPAISEATRVCNRWKSFQHDCTQHWPGYNSTYNCYPACNRTSEVDKYWACPEGVAIPNHWFQDDSGI